MENDLGITLTRYTEENVPDDAITRLADAMEARPASIESFISNREELEADLATYLTDPSKYWGAFMRPGVPRPDFWVKAWPFVPGREAMLHPIGDKTFRYVPEILIAGLGVLMRAMFEEHGMERLTFPVIDVGPVFRRVRPIYEAAGLVHEGCLRRGAYTRVSQDPCDVHLYGILKSEWEEN